MISTTEAKVKALVDEGVTDPTTGTLATGTSTDSLLIASTEEGTSINMQVPSLCLVRSLAMVFMKRCVRRLGNTKKIKRRGLNDCYRDCLHHRAYF